MDKMYPGRRVSYDGALCTIKCKADHIPGTKGEWLGVEWDDSSRGKHDGSLHGVRYFKCQSALPKIASFVRPARKFDPERTVLEAIRYKYAAVDAQDKARETVIISGKVAEEIGFDKIIKEQGMLANIKIMILDTMTISGIALRGASIDVVHSAQQELLKTCPNVTDLDLSHNPIEHWADIEDICHALPKLRTLKLNVRLHDLKSRTHSSSQTCFENIQELHLNKCLLSPSEILEILQASNSPRFPALKSLWLSQNEFTDFDLAGRPAYMSYESVNTLIFEDNLFTTLDPITSIVSVFPRVTAVSFQSNKVKWFGAKLSTLSQQFKELANLNLSRNDIMSLDFIDMLSQAFPNLAALQISKNPAYDIPVPGQLSTQFADTSYYLTLARIPYLKTLNHTEITPREREEGEIYYLSVVEKEIRIALEQLSTKSVAEASIALSNLIQQYPRYRILCEKHDRDDLLSQFQSIVAAGDVASKPGLSQNIQQKSYPPGSIASRLVTATFYPLQRGADGTVPYPPSSTESLPAFTQTIPNTIPTSSLYSLVSRKMHLPSLSFKLVYESEELDPVRDDLTTRSQIYSDPAKGATRWNDWGDWDADALVEQSLEDEEDADVKSAGHMLDEERWTADGVLIKGGRKWRKREVDMHFGMRSWGGWLESGVKICNIRVEPVST